MSTGACGQCAPKAAVVAVLSTSIDLLWRNPVLSGRGWLTLRLRLRLRLRTGVTNPMWGRHRLSEWRELLIPPGHCQCSMFTFVHNLFVFITWPCTEYRGPAHSPSGIHGRPRGRECVCCCSQHVCNTATAALGRPSWCAWPALSINLLELAIQ